MRRKVKEGLMGKNKSKHRVRTDYAARVAAMRQIDNELKKQPGHKVKGEAGNGRRKADTADND